MSKTPWTYNKVLAVAVTGLLLIGAGLWLAAMSHPARYSSHVSNDRIIDLFAISGFVCTIAGAALFMKAAGQTTACMSPRQKTNTNIGIGLGFAIQLVGLLLLWTSRADPSIGLLLILVSLPLFLFGSMHYAKGKGYTEWIGVLGILGIIGLGVLILLPDRSQPAKPLPEGSSDCD